MRSDRFSEFISGLDYLTDSQCLQVLLHIREIESDQNTAKKEVMASFNSLSEDACIAVLKQIKKQFDPEDWETIVEII